MPKPRLSLRLRCSVCARNLADVTVPVGYPAHGSWPVDEVLPRPGVPSPEVTRTEPNPMFGTEGTPSRYRFTCRCGATPVVRHDRLEHLADEALAAGIPAQPRVVLL